jgi:hypothetical protein
LKFLQERVGDTLEFINIDNNLLNSTQMAQQLKESINKWNCMKLKTLCTRKEMATKLKRLPTAWKKIFARYTSDKGLIIRICREFT